MCPIMAALLQLSLQKVYASCNATVLELVDRADSKSAAAMRGGSSPPSGTTFKINLYYFSKNN